SRPRRGPPPACKFRSLAFRIWNAEGDDRTGRRPFCLKGGVMRIRILALTALSFAVVVAAAPPPSSGPVEFRPHDIEAKFPGGYAVGVIDVNKDGKLDVIGTSQRVPELAWYE